MILTINITACNKRWENNEVQKQIEILTESSKDALALCGHIGGAIQETVINAIQERIAKENKNAESDLS